MIGRYVLNEYLVNVEMDRYGPYPSEEHARYAQDVFTKKHPDMAAWCSISPITSDADYLSLIDPHFLH